MSDWINVSDQLPDDFKTVIVAVSDADGGAEKGVFAAWHQEGEWFFFTEEEPDFEAVVTAWMPMPAHPDLAKPGADSPQPDVARMEWESPNASADVGD